MTRNRASNKPRLFDPRADHTRRANAALQVIGWLSFLRLDLSGFIWLWFAERIRQRRRGFRAAAICLLGFHVAVGMFILTWTLLGHQGVVKVAAWQVSWEAWVVYLIAPPVVALYALPMVWLLLPGTRLAFERRRERGLCYGCGYDLRHSAGRCPECGRAIPAEQAVYIRLSAEAAERLDTKARR